MNDLSRNKAAGGDKALNVLKDNTVIRLYLVCYINAALVKNEFHDPFKQSNIFRVEDPIKKKLQASVRLSSYFVNAIFVIITPLWILWL